MPYYTDQPTTIEKDGRTYTVKLEVDTDIDTSYLGEYARKADTWSIWRRDGTLRGAYNDEPEPTEPDPESYPYDEAGTEAWNRAYTAYDKAYAAWQENDPVILASDQHRMGWNELAYFIPYAGGVDPEEDPETWAKNAIRDYDRMEDLNRGGWCYVGVVVTTDAPSCETCEHTETLYASVWGIESDSGDDYKDMVVDDLIAELDAQL